MGCIGHIAVALPYLVKDLHCKDSKKIITATHTTHMIAQLPYKKPLKASYFEGLTQCCGDPTRTDDLQVMSLASCQLLHSAIIANVLYRSFASAKLQFIFVTTKCFPPFFC